MPDCNCDGYICNELIRFGVRVKAQVSITPQKVLRH